jgi:crotonobetainyl-CoA:carnitine CoA-transferase CaiB-like acyl-CoA transferase
LEHSNRGKKSIGIDLTTQKGIEVVYELAATCDVFLTNKLPAVRQKLHVEKDDIRDVYQTHDVLAGISLLAWCLPSNRSRRPDNR